MSELVVVVARHVSEERLINCFTRTNMQAPCTDAEKQLIWDKRKKGMAAIMVICGRCGGGSTASCLCAYQRFHPSQADLNDLRHKQNDPFTDGEKARIWATSYKHGNAAACLQPGCAKMPRHSCPCAFAVFTPSKGDVFMLRWRDY